MNSIEYREKKGGLRLCASLSLREVGWVGEQILIQKIDPSKPSCATWERLRASY